MADEEEVVIKIDEEPAVNGGEVKKEEPKIAAPDNVVADLAQQHEELKKREEESRRGRDEAQRQAAESRRQAIEARQQADQAREQAASSNLDTINTALASASSEVESAKRDIRTLSEAGDHTALADAYERLAAAKALSLRYDEAKADIEAAKRRTPAPRQVEQFSSDPVESYVANRTEPTTRWLRAHTDYITDSQKNKMLNRAHFKALGDGIEPDTQEYFDHVETSLGMKAADSGDNVQRPGAAKKPVNRPVAPVGGSAGNGGSNSSEVRLSQREATAAQDGTHVWNYDDPSPQKKFKKGDPIGVQEFARRKRDMTKAGHYDRSYETQ